MTNAFKRLHAVMAAVGALMAGNYAAMPGVRAATVGEAFQLAGGYTSRGKGKTAQHNRGGTRAYQRAALKRRNKQRNRLAHRG